MRLQQLTETTDDPFAEIPARQYSTEMSRLQWEWNDARNRERQVEEALSLRIAALMKRVPQKIQIPGSKDIDIWRYRTVRKVDEIRSKLEYPDGPFWRSTQLFPEEHIPAFDKLVRLWKQHMAPAIMWEVKTYNRLQKAKKAEKDAEKRGVSP
jgi:hypothetical protein